MKRRTYLISSATLVATTGCLGPSQESDPDGSTGGQGGDGTGSPTPTDSSGDDQGGEGSGDDSAGDDPAGTSSVTMSKPVVQPGYVQLGTPDSIGVFGDAGQYLLVHASHEDGPVPGRSEFSLTVGDTEYAPEELRGLWVDGDYGVEYDAEAGSGWLVFDVPAEVAADSATVTWPGGQWTVPSATRDRLATPPASFDVSFEAPDSVAAGETPVLTMTVTNTADVAGKFVFAMNRVGPDVAYMPVRSGVLELDAGESVTREWDGETPTQDRDVEYHLRTKNHDRMSRTTTLES